MSPNTSNILVTGANGGLGLGICTRLIDDFYNARDATDSLNIIFTTRSSRKGSDTLKALQYHLERHHTPEERSRVTFKSENVDLTNLLSVRDLAHNLLDSDIATLDAVFCNAGIGGWTGLNWPQTLWDVTVDIRNNTTFPEFKLGTTGALTKKQLPPDQDEPVLGEVFCANVFGHYMLLHWLMPLLRACSADKPGKIIFISSIEPQDYHFKEDDLQGLRTSAAYENSKRLSDLLVLTSNQYSSAEAVESFTSPTSKLPVRNSRPDNGAPSTHVYHPGILCTTVMSIPYVLFYAYMSAIYIARWTGANWSTVQPYTAADGATWLAFASQDEIRTAELNAHAAASFSSSSSDTSIAKDGKVKWGTSISRLGTTTVRPTEVARWGLNGSGQPYAQTWWGGLYGPGGKYGRGRRPGAVEATGEDVEAFVAMGGRVWTEMERLRQEWEKRIDESGV